MNQPPFKIWYIYKITNLINNKNYIGQATCIKQRWRSHRRAAVAGKPIQPVHHALIKHGLENFNFEVIACCKSQEDANNAETKLVEQYNSYIGNGYGYNATYGGSNAPKTDAWKASLKKWRDSLSEEDKLIIRNKQAEATKKQIQTKGHPAQGRKLTEEQLQNLRQALKNKKIEYTPELRKKLSDAHKGKSLPKEVVAKIVASRRANWLKNSAERYLLNNIRCHAPNCNVYGQALYVIVDNIRYCSKHGQRLKRNGHFELLPKKPIIMTDEIRAKISNSKKGKNLGRIPHNKVLLTEEQINYIINDPRSIMELSKVLNIGRKVIGRIRREYNKINSLHI